MTKHHFEGSFTEEDLEKAGFIKVEKIQELIKKITPFHRTVNGEMYIHLGFLKKELAELISEVPEGEKLVSNQAAHDSRKQVTIRNHPEPLIGREDDTNATKPAEKTKNLEVKV